MQQTLNQEQQSAKLSIATMELKLLDLQEENSNLLHQISIQEQTILKNSDPSSNSLEMQLKSMQAMNSENEAEKNQYLKAVSQKEMELKRARDELNNNATKLQQLQEQGIFVKCYCRIAVIII